MRENDRETPQPAFPPWLRALDPVLAREDTNGLFQAFRARRLRRGRAAMYLRDHWQELLVTTGSMVYCLLSFKRTGNPILGVAIMWGAIGLRYGIGKLQARTQGNLPLRALEFFGPKAIGRQNPQVALDLWLCPASGAEVAEAIYLEQREVAFEAATISLALTWAMLAAVYLLIVAPPLAQLWKEAFPLAMMLVFMWRLGRYHMGAAGIATAHRVALAVVESWQARLTGGWTSLPHVRQKTRATAIGMALVLAAMVAFCVGGKLLTAGGFANQLKSERALTLVCILAVAILVTEAIVAMRNRLGARPDFEGLARQASGCYGMYMRREFLGED